MALSGRCCGTLRSSSRVNFLYNRVVFIVSRRSPFLRTLDLTSSLAFILRHDKEQQSKKRSHSITQETSTFVWKFRETPLSHSFTLLIFRGPNACCFRNPRQVSAAWASLCKIHSNIVTHRGKLPIVIDLVYTGTRLAWYLSICGLHSRAKIISSM